MFSRSAAVLAVVSLRQQPIAVFSLKLISPLIHLTAPEQLVPPDMSMDSTCGLPYDIIYAIALRIHPHDLPNFEIAFSEGPGRPLILRDDLGFADESIRHYIADFFPSRRRQCPALAFPPTNLQIVTRLNLYKLGPAFVAAAIKLVDLVPDVVFPGENEPFGIPQLKRLDPLPWVRNDPAPIASALRLLEERDAGVFFGLDLAWFLIGDDEEMLGRWMTNPRGRDVSGDVINMCAARLAPKCMRRLLAAPGLKPHASSMMATAKLADVGLFMDVVDTVKPWADAETVHKTALEMHNHPWEIACAFFDSGMVRADDLEATFPSAMLNAGEAWLMSFIDLCHARGVETTSMDPT
ncbi:hypothetical protein HK101_003026 [Irineochytrium annulatum]|nr:hypothetical protein HK101_003026 [Irineochytrium annulatum]